MRVFLFAAAACVVLFTAGCHEKPEQAPKIRIAPTIHSRVTGLHFDNGDRIGLTVSKASGTYVENRMMTYDGTAFTSEGLMWYNDLNEQSTLTAYYPYAQSGVPATFSVATDQRAGTAPSDLLVAVKSAVTPGSAPIGMLFRHMMSQLSIRITNTSDSQVAGVTLGGLVPTAKVDFATPSATADAAAAAADIQAFEATPDVEYRAILVPQTAALTVTVDTKDGKKHSRTLAATPLACGMRYDLSVEVTNIDIMLKLSGDIEDWQDGGTIGESGGTPGTLSYEGETYRTATIDGRVWMAENLRYAPADAVQGDGIWYPVGGESSVSSQGMLYDYRTAAGTASVRSAYVQGICPAGWHLPTLEELTSLAGSADAGGDFLCCGGYWIALNQKYGTAQRGYLMGAELDANGQCNCLMYASLGSPSIVQFSPDNGMTVRCVKDA